MPRPKSSIPAYSLHKPSGQACVYIDRRRVYLGKHGSPASKRKYLEVLDNLQAGRHDPTDAAPRQVATVPLNDIFLPFLLHAARHYHDPKAGRPSHEYDCFKSAIRPARELFGEMPVGEFGPVRLAQVREQYIAAGWSRGFINKSIVRLRHVFKWACSKELCPVAVLHALQTLEPLRAGKSAARETKRRQAVPQEHLTAVRAELSELCRDLFDLLLLSGARPGELQSLTGSMIDRSGPVWVATIHDHKNAWRGMERKLHFGPQAQLILKRRLSADPDRRLFKMSRFTLTKALSVACDKLGIPRFSPYYLRHTRATEIRDQMGLEHAQAALGHQNPSMTLHYASKLDNLAADVAAKLG